VTSPFTISFVAGTLKFHRGSSHRSGLVRGLYDAKENSCWRSCDSSIERRLKASSCPQLPAFNRRGVRKVWEAAGAFDALMLFRILAERLGKPQDQKRVRPVGQQLEMHQQLSQGNAHPAQRGGQIKASLQSPQLQNNAP
jgi:hypothetical protein